MNATDIEDWIEDEQRYARVVNNGDTPTPRQFAEHFLRLSPHERATKLAALDKALASSELGLESAGRIHSVRRALRNADQLARRVNR